MELMSTALQAFFMTPRPGWLTPLHFPLYTSPSQFPEEQRAHCQAGYFPTEIWGRGGRQGGHFLPGTPVSVSPSHLGDFPLEPVTRLFQERLLHQTSRERTQLCLFCFLSPFSQDVFGNSL